MTIEEKLSSLGLELPNPPVAGGSYIPVRVAGNLAITAGQTACINGERRYLGKVGSDVTFEQGMLSARDACLNCLSALKAELGSLDRIVRIIRLVGYVNSAPGFTQQPQVVNGASDLLVALWGDDGRHVRSASGAAEMPVNTSVEIDMIVEIDPAGR